MEKQLSVIALGIPKLLQKMWLLKCILRPVSEHPAAVNVLKCREHCKSLQETTFTLFFHHVEVHRAEKRSS